MPPANETLLVVGGDHGQAFGENNEGMTGKYENGHISNFRVPLIFHHRHMPSTTALSTIPIVLDLPVRSNSLGDRDSEVASSLEEYHDQTLLRPFLSSMEEPPPYRRGYYHPPPDGQPEHEQALSSKPDPTPRTQSSVSLEYGMDQRWWLIALRHGS
ncbi:hypothetical protein E8E15_001131 [Penicillium rubens]|nr:hypothetical protein E8E15_001131 [Penicillium rubens]